MMHSAILLIALGLALPTLVTSYYRKPARNDSGYKHSSARLGDRCGDDSHCYGISGKVECNAYKCICSAGYTAYGYDYKKCVVAREGSSCRAPISQWACEKDRRLNCVHEVCQARKKLGDSCHSQQDCYGISGAKCYNYKCVCKPGRTSYGQYKCVRAKKGSDCSGPINAWACERNDYLSCAYRRRCESVKSYGQY